MPLWGFDGSSTMQAEGKKSDCVLKPVALYPDGARKDAYLVLCEVMHPDGTPHSTNARHHRRTIPTSGSASSRSTSFTRMAVRWASRRMASPAPRVPYYCGVGYKYMGSIARQIVEEHLELCLYRRHQPRRHQRRSGQGPVGVPDLRQGLAKAADDLWMPAT
jgi:glutamine synthetase